MVNSLSAEEWKTLKLPPPSTACPRPNVQLPDLVCSQSLLPDTVISSLDLPQAVDELEVAYEIRSQVCHEECHPGLGGEVFCLFEDSLSAAKPLRRFSV